MQTRHQDMIVTHAGPGRASVAIAGEVDAANARHLRVAILDAARNHGARVEVDLTGVTFMDSSGLRAIADASRTLESSGSALVLCNVPRQVMRLMEVADIGPLEIRG